jgi:mannose-6-phosphate isomerase-like protein (cupin superfamily)
LDVEFYQPKGEDRQRPHDRDELYIIARGSGILELAGERHAFTSGDLIYVAAHAVHRFVEFSGDFAAWVVFWP